MKSLLFLLLISFLCLTVRAQEWEDNDWKGYQRALGIHTNILYWGAMTPNLGVELPLARQWSLDVTGMYARWDFRQNKKYRLGGIQPELRWWCCQNMTRHYVGLHFQYADFNIGEEMYRRDGHLLGGGISYGYVWVISPRWNIDFSAGVGYARIEYDKYGQECGRLISQETRNYWGPTRLGVTFTYKIPY